MVLAMPRDSVFWKLYAEEPTQLSGESARDALRSL